jgi:hypothetical protein
MDPTTWQTTTDAKGRFLLTPRARQLNFIGNAPALRPGQKYFLFI